MRICVTDGNNRIALAAVRALGAAGHDVVSIEQRRFAARTPICFSSRYVSRRSICSDIDNENAALREMLASAKGCDVILPVSINVIYFCAGNRDEFEKAGISVAAPTIDMLDKVNEKHSFLELAGIAGVETPKSYSPSDEKEFETVSERIRYPAIVKLASDRGLYLPPWERYRFGDNKAELESAWKHFTSLNPKPLIQEFVDGTGLGYFFLSDGKGSILREMCHRRIREYPVGGGPSTLCVTVRDEKLRGLGRRIVFASGFRGVGMVEFKGTPDGRYVALEINPRLWGSLPLGMAAGVNFPEAWARFASGRKVEPDFRYRIGARARFVAHDILAGLSYFRRGRPGKVFAVLADFLKCGISEGVITLKDPSPGITYLLDRLKPKAEGGR
ncbi:MAG: carboxylate--amine ligase [Planctomycetota bacterium]